MSDASSYVSSREAYSSRQRSPTPTSLRGMSQVQQGSSHSSGSQRSGGSSGRPANSRNSGSGSSRSSNPFRNGSRDNLPSFADCFDGVHRLDHLGEHNIVAMSPPQAWTAPPPSALWSGGHQSQRQPSTSTHFSSGHQYHGSGSSHSATQRLSPGVAPSPSHHHVPITSMFSPIQRGTPSRPSSTTPNGKPTVPFVGTSAESPGRSLPLSHQPAEGAGAHTQIDGAEQFSYRTLDLSEDDEAASDPVGTPPRAIERANDDDDIGSSEGAYANNLRAQQSQGHGTPNGDADGNQVAGLRTPNNRPPLHPALSPIVAGSPIYEVNSHREIARHDDAYHPPPSVILHSPGDGRRASPARSRDDSTARHPQMHQASDQRTYAPPGGAYPRQVNPTLLTPPRRARSLEELAAKHLFPLFGAFLRTLPPKQLEHFLVHDEAIFDDDAHGMHNHNTSHHNIVDRSPAKSHHIHYDTRSVGERVDAIVPPLDDLLDMPRDAIGSSPYAFRDFAYRHPTYADSIGTSLRLRMASRW